MLLLTVNHVVTFTFINIALDRASQETSSLSAMTGGDRELGFILYYYIVFLSSFSFKNYTIKLNDLRSIYIHKNRRKYRLPKLINEEKLHFR